MNKIQDPAYKRLVQQLKSFQNLGIAFSGGVDSTFLLAAASDALDDKVMAYTVQTVYMPLHEIEETIEIAKGLRVNHRIISLDIPEQIRQNPPERCYLCKKELFSRLWSEAIKDNIAKLADGSNYDDNSANRPGTKALRELGIISPLQDAGLTKADIRRLSALLGLPTSEKPAYACLLTRIPYNTEIKEAELRMIEKAETYLHSLGFKAVRVRLHDKLARIEMDPEQLKFLADPAVSVPLHQYFKEIGFTFVTLDLEGYRTGGIDPNKHQQ